MNLERENLPILLVEGDSYDEARIVRAYSQTAHRNRMIVARTAENALTLLRACANGLRFGLVLLDLHVPRFGAVDLIQRIRKDRQIAETPLVVMAPSSITEEDLIPASNVADCVFRRPERTPDLSRLLDGIVKFFMKRGHPEKSKLSEG
jgi:CheY-like chemotaxis protein